MITDEEGIKRSAHNLAGIVLASDMPVTVGTMTIRFSDRLPLERVIELPPKDANLTLAQDQLRQVFEQAIRESHALGKVEGVGFDIQRPS